MRLISIIAYSITLITLAALEFGDSSWTLYLHTVKTVSAAGVFNYSLTPSVVMHYNLTLLPEYVTLDGTTVGEPVGIFSPVLVACIALGLAILGHLIFLLLMPFEASMPTTSGVLESISTLFINITKLILVILVFMVSGMRDVGSIMLICGVQVAIAFMYFVLLHTNDPRNGAAVESVPPPPDPEKGEPTRTPLDDNNTVLRLTLLLVLMFQYVALGVVISGNVVQMNMLYVTAVFLFVHDLFYFLAMAVLVPGNFACGDMGTSGDTKLNLAIFFDWLISVPIPFFIYFSLHNAVA